MPDGSEAPDLLPCPVNAFPSSVLLMLRIDNLDEMAQIFAQCLFPR